MTNKDVIIRNLSELFWADAFVNELFMAAGVELDSLEAIIDELGEQIFFDKLTYSLSDYEKLLDIKPTSTQAIGDRRSAVQAKWKGSGKIDIALIQAVCNAWRNGEVDVSFESGKIKLEFNGAFGVPADMDGLLSAINEIKPAHLAFWYVFKWLLKGNIHNVKTKSEMKLLTKSMFARGGY